MLEGVIMITVFGRDFYNTNSIVLAKALLGKILIHEQEDIKLMAKIVETEAYMGPSDKAAHSYKNRRTERNEVMYGHPGFAYVYFIYGMYYCMNVVANCPEVPEAVLIRAVEPVNGLEAMSMNRYGKRLSELIDREKINLTNGPGKLCMALNITRKDNGEDLCNSKLYIAEEISDSGEKAIEDSNIISTKRINIDYAEEAADYPWRFYIKGNKYVSRK